MKKRADGRYSKQVTVGVKNGKPIKKTVYGKTIKELEKNFRALMILVDRGVILDSQSMTVKELYDEWYRLKKEGKIRRSTELAYISKKKWIIDELGEMKARDIKQYNVETLVNTILLDGYTSRAKTVLQTLRSMFDYAVEHDIVAKNPCLGISVKYEPKERRTLTPGEITAIDNSDLPLRDKAYLYLMRYTGMRRGEIFALDKSDLDKKESTIHVSKTLVDNMGKPFIQDMTKTDAGDRYIPVFLKLFRPLFEYIENVDGLLFSNRNGKYMSIYSQDLFFNRIVKELGLGNDLTMHCFRHNFVSECYAAKVDIKKVQSWVGHDDVSTTLNIYTKLSKQEVQNATEMNIFYGSQTEVKPKSKKKKTS